MVWLLRILDFWSSLLVRVIVIAGAIWVPLNNLIDTTVASIINTQLMDSSTPLGLVNERTSQEAITTTVIERINAQLMDSSTPLGLVNERAAVLSENAIIITDTECSRLGDGWVIHDAAAGRFPVSAGESADINGEQKEFEIGQRDTDGEYTHILLPEEMPRHAHVQVSPERCSGDNCLDGGGDVHILVVGEGRPYNNIPPYFVVRFCKKG